jgi:phage terminase large subunit-like protein
LPGSAGIARQGKLISTEWTEQDVRWISLERWDRSAALPPELSGRVCFAGLDLSSTTDITALVLVFEEEGQYAVHPFFWVPEEGARQRERRDKVPYLQWIRQGLIEATPGDTIDYDRIRAQINAIAQVCDLREVALDRWNATQLSTQLTGDGIPVVAFGQGYASMNWPTKKLDGLIRARRLAHGGNPVLRWMAGNVMLETDAADNWKPSKKKSRERIDGVVALIMAIDRATTHVPPYEYTPGSLRC